MEILEVIEVSVLLTDGPDKILLKTKLPCPFVKGAIPSQPPLELSFEATYDTGIDYCRRVFGYEVGDLKVVDVR